MRRLVESGTVPGVIGYVDGVPAGWCSAGPRQDFVRLETSRLLKPLDDQPVWSIVCLFVRKQWRRQGLAVHLVRGACELVRNQGGAIVEAYPIVPARSTVPEMTAWTGFPAVFEAAGFTLVARPSEARAIYRLTLQSR
jgi:GNAT superfamily N-acetyltransferase